MRLIISYCVLILTLSIIGLSCKEDDLAIPYFDFEIYWKGTQEHGNAIASVFDKTWEASAYVFPDVNQPKFFSVIFETYSDGGFIRDVIQFGNFLATVGEYSVTQDTSANSFEDNIIYGFYSQYEDDGDVLYGYYVLDMSYNNVVYIDKIDTENQELEGRFSFLFNLSEEYYDRDLAKRVLFEDGKFKVKL